jgi:hypothetical protein
MNADIKGAFEQLNISWKCFQHRGRRMSKEEVRTVLMYAIDKGYITTEELSDEEVDNVLSSIKKPQQSHRG